MVNIWIMLADTLRDMWMLVYLTKPNLLQVGRITTKEARIVTEMMLIRRMQSIKKGLINKWMKH